MNDFNELTEEDLTNLTAKELKAILALRNDELGTAQQDGGYLTTGGTKKDLISNIVHSQEINGPKLGVTEVANNRTTVSNSQLVIHSLNFRDGADYFDPRLQERFRKSGYEFLHDLVVTPNGDTVDGEPVYRVVSGNRSLWNFRFTCEEDDVSLDSVDIPVNIREYTDEDTQQAGIAEILEIGMANEAQRQMSPVDKMRWFTQLSKEGLTQTAIAKEVYGPIDYKNKQSIISKTMKLGLLPDEILQLVHYDFNAANYIANGITFLEEQGIPFVSDEDGVVTVLGITQSAAEEMMKLYPRTNAEGADEGIAAVNKFLVSHDEILTRAAIDTASAFKHFLLETAEDAGLREPPTKKSSSQSSDGLNEDLETSTDEVLDLEAGMSMDNAADEREPVETPSSGYKSVDLTTYEAATDLENGQLHVAVDFNKQLAELLHSNETDSLAVVKFLMYHGLIEDAI